MGRTVAVVWHASFSIAAGVLYFFFVLPRWPELLGDTSHTLGTVLRIVTGALIGLAALPVVFTLLRTRRPEFGTPRLALTLRTSSIALHVLAGVVIVGTAISEIWLTVDSAGQWLFGLYGAAAAIALLGIFAFYLAFAAELPPPPPKPLKAKKTKQGRRGRRKATEDTEDVGEDAAEDADAELAEDVSEEGSESESDEKPESDEKAAEVTAEAEEPESTADEPEPAAEEDQAAKDEAPDAGEPQSTNGRLRNRRRRRLRGGVAVED
ncbi:MAG: hypothetical protein JWQ31_1280 [Mycobacterium sp.]|jgi:hypothetical protein|nr:hypothetical protein [Mycobacterium sp.]